MALTKHEEQTGDRLDFETLVARFYPALYRFALSLTHEEPEASDLTQQTFYIWARKGHQLEDPSKVKSWLFTTLHREFLQTQRRALRFPHHELPEASDELSAAPVDLVSQLDAVSAVQLLAEVDSRYQAPVALFYLEDYSYKEIAQILQIPLGTVKSRIARGISQLQAAFARNPAPAAGNKRGNL